MDLAPVRDTCVNLFEGINKVRNELGIGIVILKDRDDFPPIVFLNKRGNSLCLRGVVPCGPDEVWS